MRVQLFQRLAIRSALAKQFKVILHPAHFEDPSKKLMTMSLDAGQLNSELEDGVLFQVNEIAVHNSCGIQVEPGYDFQWIAKIPKHAVDKSPHGNFNPADHYYAIRRYHGGGRVIIAGNSGLAGDDGCTMPAPGTILYANNLLFLLNCFKELARITPAF